MVEKRMGGEAASDGVVAGVSVNLIDAVEVIVRTMVVGVGISVSTIVEKSVVTSNLVVGGNVEAGSVMVVVAAAPDEPPSTATTE